MSLARKLLRGAAGAGVTSLAFQASATSINSQITVPVGAAAGDWAIIFDSAATASPPGTLVIPSSWANVKGEAPAGLAGHYQVSHKILTGGDPGAVLTGLDAASEEKVMLVYRPNGTISTVTISTWNGEVTDGDPSSQNVAAAGQLVPLIVFGMSKINNSTAAFATASPAFDATVASADNDLLVGYKIYNSSPADHTIDMADLGSSNILVSGYIRFS